MTLTIPIKEWVTVLIVNTEFVKMDVCTKYISLFTGTIPLKLIQKCALI